jgi:hypothetical protein
MARLAGRGETGRSALPRWPTSLTTLELEHDDDNIHCTCGLERSLIGEKDNGVTGGVCGAGPLRAFAAGWRAFSQVLAPLL